MATNPSTLPENSGRITPPNTSYPYGSAKDDSTGSTGDGTPIKKAFLNDIYGFFQRLLTLASITPSGVAETAVSSDVGNALEALYGKAPVLKVYTATGTYARTTGCKVAVVEAVGGGGGGGGNTGGNTASGGAAGGYARKLVANPPSSLAITIGSAGSGGAAGNGGNGGNTAVTGTGVAITANGGAGGRTPPITLISAGGTATGGDINIPGGDGGLPHSTSAGGNGGASFFGGGGAGGGSFSGGDPTVGRAYGSGGGGAHSSGGDGNGRAGAAGYVLITEYF